MEVLRGCERVIRLNEPNLAVGMLRGSQGWSTNQLRVTASLLQSLVSTVDS
jgi:hypothetical protein